jgi:hypothetical protein
MVVKIISTIDDANAIIVPMIVAVSKYMIVSLVSGLAVVSRGYGKPVKKKR